ncbi:MAG TPA: BMC domain-containing protein [Halanaerobiales bacterium]|nr:BMC domain-containing protein [Halanaerobiales bacterium]
MIVGALGLVEVRGLVTGIHVLDAMIKAAGVKHICTKKKMGGGLVTVVVEGDVGAVKAAVEAGGEAGSRISEVFCAEVIARPHEGIIEYLK